MGRWEDVGSAALLAIQNGDYRVGAAATYARTVADKALRRQKIGAAAEVAEANYAEQDDRPALALFEELTAHPDGAGDDLLAGVTPVDWPAFWAREPNATDWLIEPMIPAGRQVATHASAKVGKSLLALEATAARTTGRPVLGLPPVEPIEVVYIDNEMTEDDLCERLEDLGYGPDVDLSRLHYYQLTALPPLDTSVGGQVLLGLARRHGAALVVVDTVASSVAGEENSADTLRDFYRHTGRLLKADGVALWRLDHSGKEQSRGQRGTSAKADDVDVVYRLTDVDSEGFLTLTRTHTRLSWVPPEVKLRRETEPLLHHVLAPTGAWPAGTAEVATLLDDLCVPTDATQRDAMTAVKKAGKGRRTAVVSAALKYRRGRQ